MFEEYSLCWAIFVTTWRHLLFCVGASAILAVLPWRSAFGVNRNPLHIAGCYFVGSVVPLITSIFIVGAFLEWTNKPAIGALLRLSTDAQLLFKLSFLYEASLILGLASIAAYWRELATGAFSVAARSIPRIVLVAFAAVAVFFLFNVAFREYTELPDDLDGELYELLSSAQRFTSIAMLSVFSPIAEELFFRGIIQSALSSSVGIARAIFVQAAIFATVHFQFDLDFFQFFAAGVIFGMCMHYSRSLLGPIVAHISNNILFLVLS